MINNFISGAIENNEIIEILNRQKDERDIDMFKIRTRQGKEGWVYAKNVIEKNLVCPICIDTIKASDLHTTKCSHQFHRECFRKIFDQGLDKCPICRADIEPL